MVNEEPEESIVTSGGGGGGGLCFVDGLRKSKELIFSFFARFCFIGR